MAEPTAAPGAPTLQTPVPLARGEKTPPNPVVQTRNRLLMGIGAGLVVIGLGFFFFTKPAVSAKSTAAANLVTAQDASTAVSAQLATSKASGSNSAALYQQSLVLDQLLPAASTFDSSKLGTDVLTALVTSAGCTIKTVSNPLAGGSKGGANYVSFVLSMSCSTTSLQNFLSSVAVATPLITVDAMVFGTPPVATSGSSSGTASASTATVAGLTTVSVGLKVWDTPAPTLPTK